MTRRTLAVRTIFTCIALCSSIAEPVCAQENPTERLQREQNEVLSKAERLRELMTRLLTRYERDGKKEQVTLLKSGLAHFEQSRLLGAAAEIPTNLDAGAYDNAVREQATVIAELESLLDILLERQSVENLDQQIKETAELIEEAGELLDRQRQIREQGQQAHDRAPQSEAEREFAEELAQLANAQRAESRANQRRAGRQLPVLEAALERITDLLRAQQKLEDSAAQQLAGAPDPSRTESFELGSIEQAQRDLNGQRARQHELERLAQDAEQLSDAAEQGADADRLRQALDQLRARLDAAQNSAQKASDEATRAALEKTRAALQAASADARDTESKQQLVDAAREVQRAGESTAETQRQQIGAAQRALVDRVKAAATNAEETRDGKGNQPTGVSRALDRAADAMDRAAKPGRKEEAIAAASSALRQLAEARRDQRAANPDAAARARQMANTAEDVARDLAAAPETGDLEGTAAKALKTAEEALRDVDAELERHAGENGKANKVGIEQSLNTSRAALEQTLQTLQKAMQSATPDGTQQQANAAAARQQELQQQAERAGERLDAERAAGELEPAQADAAKAAIERARDSMQRASEHLEAGQPSSASKSQSDAADSLDRATESLEQNRPVGDPERRELEDLAKQQEQLEEDIIRLAELTRERENQQAADALQRAADASKRTQRKLDDGDQPEAKREQQQVEEQLAKARDSLEEEQDRYMDLRQEELLFRIREELTEFLEAQRPLTKQTEEFGASITEHGRLSRPSRRKLNQIADREGDLVTRTQFILAALIEEGVKVFAHALRANVQDLEDIRERLSGRRPDPGEFTVMLQHDVEDRAQQLIQALQNEQERRRQERQQQQQQPKNKFDEQAKPLVPLIAELEMLRQMEEEMQLRTREVRRLLAASGADGITEFDLALAARLASQHSSISDIFGQLRSAIEQQMQQAEGGGHDPLAPQDGSEKKEKGR